MEVEDSEADRAAGTPAGVIAARLEWRDSGGCTATADTAGRDVNTRGIAVPVAGASLPLPTLPAWTELGVGDASIDCDCERDALWSPCIAVAVAVTIVTVAVWVVVARCGVGRHEGCGSATAAAGAAAPSCRANTFFWNASAHRPASREWAAEAALSSASASLLLLSGEKRWSAVCPFD